MTVSSEALQILYMVDHEYIVLRRRSLLDVEPSFTPYKCHFYIERSIYPKWEGRGMAPLYVYDIDVLTGTDLRGGGGGRPP